MSVVEIKNERTGEKRVTRSKVLDFEQGVVVNLQLKAGHKIARHHANCHVLVYVISGEVWFGVEKQKHHLKEGSLLHMNPFEEHNIEAVQNSNLLVFKVGSHAGCNMKV